MEDIKRLGDQLGKLSTANDTLVKQLAESQQAHHTAEAARAALNEQCTGLRAQVASMNRALGKAAQDLAMQSSKLVLLEADNVKLVGQVKEPRKQIDELMGRIREMKAENENLITLEKDLRGWIAQVSGRVSDSLPFALETYS
jgi:chromosome segregation ATPase